MATVILDAELAQQLREQRAACGGDRYDEVWEGTYMMAPMANNEHQELINGLTSILQDVIGWPKLGRVFPGCNVSDRPADWKENFRVPDVAVFLNDTDAVDRGSFWQGGPDFAVEIVSPGDQCREKLDFYASVKTRELLIVDRDPWKLELYRLSDRVLRLHQSCTPDDSLSVEMAVVGLKIELRQDNSVDRPSMIVTGPDRDRTWTI